MCVSIWPSLCNSGFLSTDRSVLSRFTNYHLLNVTNQRQTNKWLIDIFDSIELTFSIYLVMDDVLSFCHLTIPFNFLWIPSFQDTADCSYSTVLFPTVSALYTRLIAQTWRFYVHTFKTSFIKHRAHTSHASYWLLCVKQRRNSRIATNSDNNRVLRSAVHHIHFGMCAIEFVHRPPLAVGLPLTAFWLTVAVWPLDKLIS